MQQGATAIDNSRWTGEETDSPASECATVAAKGKAVETEAAPIQYVAAVFGVTDPEVAIRCLVLLMTLSCDPLAIALTAAAALPAMVLISDIPERYACATRLGR